MRLYRPRVISLSLIAAGVVIGIIVASEMNWLPIGTAAPERMPTLSVSSLATVLPLPLTGGGERNFVQIAKLVKPAVVSIAATRSGQSNERMQGTPFDDPFFQRFFGDKLKRDIPRERKEKGQGSGVIVNASGVIITNNHVVNKADDIRVVLSDKREFKATLLGTDSKTDIAVLKIEASGLLPITWADSNQLEVGEFVLAVGSPFGLTQTVTMGIVSAVGRASMGIAEYEDFIQTDAAINPGNSGGALVNARGELIGINTAIFSQNGGNMGIGFAVPSNLAHSIMNQLVQTGKVVRGWLGVSIQELSPELSQQFGISNTQGVLVSDVMNDSPAKKAGLERADVIVEFDGKSMDSPTHLRNAVAQTPIGKQVVIKLIREKQPKLLRLIIVEQPKSLAVSEAEENVPTATPTGVLSDFEVEDLSEALASRYGLKFSERGVVVTHVKPGSLAEEMGIRESDIILEINRKAVASRTIYTRVVASLSSDHPVLLLLKRQGRIIYLTLHP